MHALEKIKKEWRGTYRSYLIGFFLSLFLTSISFFLVANESVSQSIGKNVLIIVIISLAILQAIIQLIFFLHVGEKSGNEPRYLLMSLYSTIIILLAIVIGSIWVMNDLNQRMMPEMDSMKMEKPS